MYYRGQEQQYYVYMMSNQRHNVLYIGVTNNLERRVWEHKYGQIPSFTKKYNLDQLVYYEIHHSILEAITREKQLKAGSRKSKNKLVESINPKWQDLSAEWS